MRQITNSKVTDLNPTSIITLNMYGTKCPRQGLSHGEDKL